MASRGLHFLLGIADVIRNFYCASVYRTMQQQLTVQWQCHTVGQTQGKCPGKKKPLPKSLPFLFEGG